MAVQKCRFICRMSHNTSSWTSRIWNITKVSYLASRLGMSSRMCCIIITVSLFNSPNIVCLDALRCAALRCVAMQSDKWYIYPNIRDCMRLRCAQTCRKSRLWVERSRHATQLWLRISLFKHKRAKEKQKPIPVRRKSQQRTSQMTFSHSNIHTASARFSILQNCLSFQFDWVLVDFRFFVERDNHFCAFAVDISLAIVVVHIAHKLR